MSRPEALTELKFRKKYSPPSPIATKERIEAHAWQGSGFFKPFFVQFSLMKTTVAMGSSADQSKNHIAAGRTYWSNPFEGGRPAPRLEKNDLSAESDHKRQNATRHYVRQR